ncbi:class I SAM-dependent methyltransferase [Luteococcus sp. H138]|uniref:class I SAM-dependent methyltransferase n=1 Tax=unclassified Luteococcus TaxID=2639923 RepID=UPI00313EFB9D
MQIENREQRAQSFQSIGQEYHRLRPDYPFEVVEWMLPHNALTGRSPQRVLDLGAGSGKLTDALVARELDVVAVDPSQEMLDVLRANHPAAETHVASAEALPLPDDSVDAVVVGQAWHWMDPLVAGAEIARVLVAGGSLAMAWNADQATEPWQQAFEEVQSAPRGIQLNDSPERDPHPGEQFMPFESKHVAWQRTMTGDDFLELHKTHSAWLVADGATRAERLARWNAVLDEADAHGPVQIDYLTEVWRTMLG